MSCHEIVRRATIDGDLDHYRNMEILGFVTAMMILAAGGEIAFAAYLLNSGRGTLAAVLLLLGAVGQFVVPAALFVVIGSLEDTSSDGAGVGGMALLALCAGAASVLSIGTAFFSLGIAYHTFMNRTLSPETENTPDRLP